jgi:putative CocE/NonD family hydrolase
MHYRQHCANAPEAARDAHYLVIGPWDHAGTRTPKAEFCGLRVGPASLIDLPQLHLQWYAWTLQSGPKPDFLKKRVAYYVMGSETWRYADTLEDVTARSETLHLQSTQNPDDVFCSGALVTQPTNASPSHIDHYVHDPRDTSLAALESTIDPDNCTEQRMIHAGMGRQLIYHTAPFEADTEISGFFKLTVWLGIDQPDTDVRASIFEIASDGGSVRLCTDSVRARYRQSLRQATLVTTTAPLRYELDHFMFVSRRLARGSRLRLVIGPIHSIYSQKNYNSGGDVATETVQDARTVTVRLYHDDAHPSVLSMPVGQPGTNEPRAAERLR